MGTLPVVDAASLYLARACGWFAAEGLQVEIEQLQGGAFAIPRLVGGSLDLAMLNYVSVVTAQAARAGNFKIVGDAYQAAPRTFEIMVPAGSTVKVAADLRGKRIAVVSLNGIATLAVENVLRIARIPVRDVQFVTMGLPDMLAAMKTGNVDAAFLSEPFITQAENAGATAVADAMSGAMTEFPIAGWGATDRWVTEHPRTVQAFRAAMQRAQELAATDRKAVETILPTYTKIAKDVAALMALGRYPTTLSRTRLQRVPDLMAEYGYLKNLKSPLDIGPMLLSTATSTPEGTR